MQSQILAELLKNNKEADMDQYLIYNFKCEKCGGSEYSIVLMDNKEFLLICDDCGIIHDINDFKHKIIKGEEV